MTLNSIEFFGFLIIVLILYFLIPKKGKAILLLIASLLFYMTWNIHNTIYILLSGLETFFIGILIERISLHNKETYDEKKEKTRKHLLIVGIVLQVLELFVFKYLDFSFSQANHLLLSIGSSFQFKMFMKNILLPLGISFYIFQSIGYLIDVYRRKIDAEYNIINFLLFISFFPKIIQGPIERSDGFLKQIKEIGDRGKFNYQRICNGLITIIWGLFIKMVIADRISLIVDSVFSYYFNYGTVELSFGAICYAIQIYCDFAGYSSIAVGSAKLFGFDLIQNFDCPYFSSSLKDFWHRWHISLSTWFRDYIYIPLGGSRCSKSRKRLNIILVMLISGVWHGAGWHFVAWGLIHGIYQVVGDIVLPWKHKIQKRFNVRVKSASHKLGSIVITFILIDIAWVFFRAANIGIALDYLQIMFTRFNPWVLFDDSLLKLGLDQLEMNVLIVSILIMLVVDFIQYYKKTRLDQMLETQCLWFKWGVIILLFTLIWVFGQYGPTFNSNMFIYQNF